MKTLLQFARKALMCAAMFLQSHLVIAGPLEQALETIRQAETVDEGAVGYAGDRTKTYGAYEILRDRSSKEQLFEFAKDSSANVKAYAAMALRERFPKENFVELLMAMLKDESTFEFFSGCMLSTIKIGDFYYSTLSDTLTDEDRAKVLDYLLTNGKGLDTTYVALWEWEIPESRLPVVRNLAHGGNAAALIALAKFKKEEDFPIIAESLRDHPLECYRCISINPRAEFFPLLEKSQAALLAEEFHSAEQRAFYKAAAAFKTPDAVALFSRVLDGNESSIPMREYHLEFGYEAISEYSDPVYDVLKWRFWEEMNQVDLKNFNHLLALDQVRATKLSRKSLERRSWKFSEELLTAMFARVGAVDSAFVEKIVAAELERGDVSRYSFFGDIAKRDKKDCYIEPLFRSLETSSNPHVFLEATKALLAYNQVAVNKRIRAAPAKNPALTSEWGGTAFKKLLEEEMRDLND